MPTILELFHSSGKKDSVKSDKETLIEQETTGLRVKSAVEINNPLIYGNEATRIATRSTPVLEDMKKLNSAAPGDAGLIGKGLGKLTGGKVNSLADARDKVNNKLGIPSNQIPSRIVEKISALKSNEILSPDGGGTEFGKFLKQTGGGNPTTIGKQALGKGIGLAKDKLRGALFGEPPVLGANLAEPSIIQYTNVEAETYSGQAKDENRKSYGDKEDFEKGENKDGKLDLSKVSPIYGLERGGDFPKFGTSNHAFQLMRKENQFYSPVAEQNYTGKDHLIPMESQYGLLKGDEINKISPSAFENGAKMKDEAFIEYDGKVYEDFIPMWFKKYGSEKYLVFRSIISGLTETTTPSWSANKFVGNPYAFHIYDGVERGVSFNLKLFVSSALELSGVWERLKLLTSYAYPTITGGLTTPPIIQFRIGDIYSGKTGFLDSLSYTIPDESNWETNGELGYLPKMIDASISIKFIETHGSEERLYDFGISEKAAKEINKGREDNKALEKEITNGADDTSGDEIPKETPKKKVKISLFGKKPKVKLPGLDGGKTIPSIPEEGEVSSVKAESGVTDMLGGKTIQEAVKEKKKKLTDKQADIFVGFGIQGYEEYRGQWLKRMRTHNNDDGLVIMTSKVNAMVKNVIFIFSNGNVIGPFKSVVYS
jgi:hypothetical protein|tara:strand:+ start:1583 stop:3547 length:1965 start_codon:yes stop_codon:yes gene_type:complete